MSPEKSVMAYVNHLIVSNFSYFCKYFYGAYNPILSKYTEV